MRSTLLVAGAVFAWGAAAQETTPANPNTQAPAAQSSTSTSKSTSTSGQPAEMKTQMYKGTLVDASCAGSGSAGSSASAASQGSAERSAGGQAAAGGGSSCGVSASTTRFALKTQDGKTMPFDSVGNERAQLAMKNKKKWSEMAQAGKPVKVKVGGVMTGEKLTVVTID